ncbi:unnamed protein product [Pieris brassicae]|uniref:Uncharacterized protein n=1 Tax=Pieris brassicae TaxID=7116 RepID=A0A9P0SSL7_PIEBR|nr:unnamed protein product [Pieris brassicae]
MLKKYSGHMKNASKNCSANSFDEQKRNQRVSGGSGALRKCNDFNNGGKIWRSSVLSSRRVQLRNRFMMSSDGIHPDGCRTVISNPSLLELQLRLFLPLHQLSGTTTTSTLSLQHLVTPQLEQCPAVRGVRDGNNKLP